MDVWQSSKFAIRSSRKIGAQAIENWLEKECYSSNCSLICPIIIDKQLLRVGQTDNLLNTPGQKESVRRNICGFLVWATDLILTGYNQCEMNLDYRFPHKFYPEYSDDDKKAEWDKGTSNWTVISTIWHHIYTCKKANTVSVGIEAMSAFYILWSNLWGNLDREVSHMFDHLLRNYLPETCSGPRVEKWKSNYNHWKLKVNKKT